MYILNTHTHIYIPHIYIHTHAHTFIYLYKVKPGYVASIGPAMFYGEKKSDKRHNQYYGLGH